MIPVAGSAAACVPNPKKVVTAKNTQSTKPVPAALATEYEAAATAAYAPLKASAPAAIVSVRGPKGTWSKTYGVADAATGAPVTTDMYQRIGSITKTFVGTALLQLADQGKLSLDDPIDDYVPNVPNGSHISLRELVTMTSGLGGYDTNPAWLKAFFSAPDTQWTPDQLLAASWAMPTQFPPGTNMRYANINTILLGLAIEQATGKTLTEVIKTQILDPLHLNSTTLPTDASFPSPHATGYTDQLNDFLAEGGIPGRSATGTWADATNWNSSWGWAAGAMTSRLDDVLAWGRVLATGQGVLPAAEQVKRLESLKTSTLGAGTFYGDTIACKDGWIGHPGDIFGYSTIVMYNPAIDTTIVVEATGASFSFAQPHLSVTDSLTSALAQVTGHPYAARSAAPNSPDNPVLKF